VLTTIFPLLFFALLILLSLLDMFILHRKSMKSFFLNVGVSIASSGAIMSVVGLIGGPLSFLLSRDVEIVLTRYLPWVTKMILVAGLGALAVGIILTIVSMLLRPNTRKAAKPPLFGKFEAILAVSVANVILVASCGVVFLIIFNLIREV
jgi:hypothetical protein